MLGWKLGEEMLISYALEGFGILYIRVRVRS